MDRLLWICLAGAIGTGARYLIALWASQRLGSSFPHGSVIVNLIGCFAIESCRGFDLRHAIEFHHLQCFMIRGCQPAHQRPSMCAGLVVPAGDGDSPGG